MHIYIPNDIEREEFNIIQLNGYELYVYAPYKQFCIAVTFQGERLQSEWILNIPVGPKDMAKTYSLLFHALDRVPAPAVETLDSLMQQCGEPEFDLEKSLLELGLHPGSDLVLLDIDGEAQINALKEAYYALMLQERLGIAFRAHGLDLDTRVVMPSDPSAEEFGAGGVRPSDMPPGFNNN